MKLYAIVLSILPSLGFAQCPNWLNTHIEKLQSKDVIPLCQFVTNKPLLIVNTASHCGYTEQFEGLEALHQKYKDRGLVVLGFPSNSFNQEASDEVKTADVCYRNFGVSFIMSKPVNVKGDNLHPIFKHLRLKQGEPSWNFNKYLVDANGNVLKRYSSSVKPNSNGIINDIEAVL